MSNVFLNQSFGCTVKYFMSVIGCCEIKCSVSLINLFVTGLKQKIQYTPQLAIPISVVS